METNVNQVRAEKARLRERFRITRLELAPEPRRRAEDAIVRHVQALPEWDAARTVALYWPMLTRGEVNVRPLLDALVASGRTAAFPAITARSPPTLAFRQLEGDWVESPWGLSEPPETAPLVPPTGLDLVIVPALGAGRSGARIGHGGGYYDSFLPTTDAVRVGVVYAECLIDHVPTEEHDARLDVIVTEREVVRVLRNPAEPEP